MAKVQVLVNNDDMKEKDKLMTFINSLTKAEKVKLEGFLAGMRFAGVNENENIFENYNNNSM